MVVVFVRTARAARSLPCTNCSGVHRGEVHVVRLDGFVHQQERERRHGHCPARTLLECNKVKCNHCLDGLVHHQDTRQVTVPRMRHPLSHGFQFNKTWGNPVFPVFELISGKIHHESTRRCSTLLCSWCHRLGVAFPMHCHHNSCRPTQD